MKLSSTLLNSFKLGEDNRIYKGIDKRITSTESIVRILAVTLIPIVMVSVITGIMCLAYSANIESLRHNLAEKYKESYTNKEVYVSTDIKTANITGYDNGYIKTDLGIVKSSKESTEQTIIDYKDIDNTLKNINEINKEDDKYHKYITYVTSDYNVDKSKSVVISDDKGKLEYKAYINDMSEIKSSEDTLFTIRSICYFTLVAIMIITVVMVVKAIQLNEVLSNNFETKVVLGEEDKDTKVTRIGKSREGNDTEEAAGNSASTKEEIALANEGSIYTGIERTDGETNDD